MARRRGSLRVGTSGYQYPHWRGIFYPEDLPTAKWFAYYAQHFNTVEINNTFYRLPSADVFAAWRKQAPRGFCYALKFSRFGSHLKKLKDADQTIPHFLERAARLGPYLGPILVQLPPRWRVDVARLAAFLDAAPRRRRWAFEFRDASWLCEPVYAVLERHGAALCIHDLLADHPWRTTADWVYVRFHGQRYTGSYDAGTLRKYAAKLRRFLAAGQDVFVYFNNDVGGHALHNAADLRRYCEG